MADREGAGKNRGGASWRPRVPGRWPSLLMAGIRCTSAAVSGHWFTAVRRISDTVMWPRRRGCGWPRTLGFSLGAAGSSGGRGWEEDQWLADRCM